MDKILKNKKFVDIKEVHFTPEFKRGLQDIFGEEMAKKAEKVSKKVRGFQFTYLSKNGKISGLLSVPKISGVEKMPCIIYNRGGNMDFSTLRPGALFKNLGFLAAEGYVVMASQYSGNSLSEGKDEFGGKDLDDVVALYDILKTLPMADIKRIGVYGASRGGMMTFLLMKKVKWLKAACVKSGLYDLISNAKLRPKMKEVFKECFGGSKKEMINRSVSYWANELPKNVPVLMMHGSADWRTSALDALEVSKRFIECGVPHRLTLFEGADHLLSEFSKEEQEMTIAWFEKYLKNRQPLPNLEPHGK